MSKRKAPKKQQQPPVSDQALKELQNTKISGNLEETVTCIDGLLGMNADFLKRRFHVFGQYPAVMFYYSSLTNSTMINTEILKPLMYPPPSLEGQSIEDDRLKSILINDSLYHSEGQMVSSIASLVEGILRGETVIVVDKLDEAFLVRTRNLDKRAIDQPATEQVIRGPREGFIEMLETNISLLRYRLPTTDFRIETMEIGRRSKSKVAICYMDGITNPDLLKEVNKRLSNIDIDAVLDSGYLEQYIEDNHLSPFPQVQYTERPDKVVANLLEGRVAILVDGSPLALVVPTVFSQFYQTVEDYTERFVLMSAIRMARLVALVFSLVFPALYVAVISFNPELIPTEFAVAVAGGRAGVPFPAIIEVLVIEISMEVLREATIRLPQQVGGALSIVGVLVVGQAAVAAGFSSPITVVIIALTTIGSFATPAYNAALALRLLRFPLIIMAGIFGLYGIMIGLILIMNHLLSLKSFGVPYMSPYVPGNFQGMKDLLIRGPLWWMSERPSFLQPLEKNRLGPEAETGYDMLKTLHKQTENVLDPMNVQKSKGASANGESTSDHNDPSRGNTD
ncbi:spore germination protein [Paenibacillus mendelii]|uniref:Spore germination protein n=1 Tax=Paenibacillus mendelii TaxID=206163 RepID=A0ABV6J6K6_9BACL|nr:spore germination protein [Paenibacillus mendelii]MCQ6561122.1 spore germination protein [Paenibacillus mendelii]